MYTNDRTKDPLGDDVALAFVQTTPDQRVNAANEFNNPRYSTPLYIVYAKLLDINPDGLLIASLLEVKHKSICDERGRPKANEYGVLLKLALTYSRNIVDK